MTGLNDGQCEALDRVFDNPESTFQYAMPTAIHRALRQTHPELGLLLKKVHEFVERRSRVLRSCKRCIEEATIVDSLCRCVPITSGITQSFAGGFI